jgi:trk system potassium uptake protein
MRVLIAGGGQVGALIAARLIREGNEVVVVEPDPLRCRSSRASSTPASCSGSAARVLTMREAGVRDADMVIAVSDSDEVNLLACLIAQVDSARA